MKPLCKILIPERIEKLEDYCSELTATIERCYGYDKSYCPKTCPYALTRMEDLKE